MASRHTESISFFARTVLSRIVAVATLEYTNNGLSPSKLTPEKRILGMVTSHP